MTALDAMPRHRRRGMRPKEWLVAAICFAVIAIMIAPLLFSTLASMKPLAESTMSPPNYFPRNLTWDNYEKVANYQQGVWNYVWNSLIVASMTIALCLILAVPAGYGLARFPVPGKEVLFLLMLASMMGPYQSLLMPLYLMFVKLKLTASYLGLAILHTILQLPFSIYLMRNAFEAIPKELEEAATVDGAPPFFVFRRVFLPLTVPGMVTVALFAFIMSWNEFIGALILMNTETSFTVPIMLTGVVSGDYGSVDWGALQASVMISIIPCMLVFVSLQRYYIAGFLSGAVK